MSEINLSEILKLQVLQQQQKKLEKASSLFTWKELQGLAFDKNLGTVYEAEQAEIY